MIHEAVETAWLADEKMPAPGCHAGFGVDITRLRPAYGAVTCGNCLRIRTGRPTPPAPGQLALFDDA